MLEGWLDYHRDTLLLKCAGLTAEQLKTASVEPVEAARRAAAGLSLDQTFSRRRRDGGTDELNVRWVYVHMIEEYARHNGHADLIRERIDGVTGD